MRENPWESSLRALRLLSEVSDNVTALVRGICRRLQLDPDIRVEISIRELREQHVESGSEGEYWGGSEVCGYYDHEERLIVLSLPCIYRGGGGSHVRLLETLAHELVHHCQHTCREGGCGNLCSVHLCPEEIGRIARLIPYPMRPHEAEAYQRQIRLAREIESMDEVKEIESIIERLRFTLEPEVEIPDILGTIYYSNSLPHKEGAFLEIAWRKWSEILQSRYGIKPEDSSERDIKELVKEMETALKEAEELEIPIAPRSEIGREECIERKKKSLALLDLNELSSSMINEVKESAENFLKGVRVTKIALVPKDSGELDAYIFTSRGLVLVSKAFGRASLVPIALTLTSGELASNVVGSRLRLEWGDVVRGYGKMTLSRGSEVEVLIDLLPSLTNEDLVSELQRICNGVVAKQASLSKAEVLALTSILGWPTASEDLKLVVKRLGSSIIRVRNPKVIEVSLLVCGDLGVEEGQERLTLEEVLGQLEDETRSKAFAESVIRSLLEAVISSHLIDCFKDQLESAPRGKELKVGLRTELVEP